MKIKEIFLVSSQDCRSFKCNCDAAKQVLGGSVLTQRRDLAVTFSCELLEMQFMPPL